jgi:hypothetical protein
MSVIDTANAIKKAIENDNLTLEKLGKVVCKSKFYISSHLRIANAPIEIINLINSNNIDNSTVIYEVLKLDLSLEESIEILQDYSDSKVKRSDIIKLKQQNKEFTKESKQNEKIKTPYDSILEFKKKFNYKKFETLNKNIKEKANNKLIEIKKLQNEVLELIK